MVSDIPAEDRKIDNLFLHSVIRFMWVSAKLGTCTVVIVNRTLVEAKMCMFTLESTRFLSSTSVQFTLTTVQVLNLALTHMKQIRVCKIRLSIFPSPAGMSLTNLSLAGNNPLRCKG